MKNYISTDIFCNVIDNYGDIGFCWRLAKNLTIRYNWNVSLLVNNLISFSKIEKNIDIRRDCQIIDKIKIFSWNEKELLNIKPAKIIISAFSCNLPNIYKNNINKLYSIWINLEYLHTEQWIDDYHLLPSYNNLFMKKFFFFPGFSKKSGGVIREPKLAIERNKMQNNFEIQEKFLKSIKIPKEIISFRKKGAKLIFLFCYNHSPISNIIKTLNSSEHEVILLFANTISVDLASLIYNKERIKIFKIPFVSQDEFDRILWCSDINFVRGEDSFVRAIWAKKPLIWNIYPQDREKNVDIKKIESWLYLYSPPQCVCNFTISWNKYSNYNKIFHKNFIDLLSESNILDWQKSIKKFTTKQAKKKDLIDNLVNFCKENIHI